MAREKKPVHKVQMTEGKRNIIRQLLEEYDIESAQDIQDALKDLLGGTIKEMMEAEMDDHLGYSKSERSDSDDYRNQEMDDAASKLGTVLWRVEHHVRRTTARIKNLKLVLQAEIFACS